MWNFLLCFHILSIGSWYLLILADTDTSTLGGIGALNSLRNLQKLNFRHFHQAWSNLTGLIFLNFCIFSLWSTWKEGNWTPNVCQQGFNFAFYIYKTESHSKCHWVFWFVFFLKQKYNKVTRKLRIWPV